MEREALKTFLEGSSSNRWIIFPDSGKAEKTTNKCERALQKIRHLFSKEDFVSLENLLKYKNIIDFQLEVKKIYENIGLDIKTFKFRRAEDASWYKK